MKADFSLASRKIILVLKILYKAQGHENNGRSAKP